MKNIRTKVIAAIIATTILYGTAMPAFAAQLTEQQQQELNTVVSEYETILQKMADIEAEISAITDEVTDITLKIEENNGNLVALQGQVTAKEAEIKVSEAKLNEKQIEYGDRIRAMYKQGNAGMISAILGSESLADLISRADAIMEIAKIDKQMLDEIEEIKLELEGQKAALDTSITAVRTLKAENEVSLAKSNVKKAEAEQLLISFEKEEQKIVSNLAMAELYFIGDNDDIIANANSTDEAIQGAVANLRSVREKIITETTDQKIVDLIEKGKTILNQREEARQEAARQEAARQAAARAAAQAAAKAAEQKATPTATPTTPKTPTTPTAPKTPTATTPTATASGQAVLNYAYKFLGVPYVWGGSSPSGFDCSGFTSYVFRHFGVNLPRVSRDQASVGTKVSYSNLRAGDLVFFGTSGITHVGIYIGGGNMIHSPRPGKSVEISTMKYHNFITARRVIGN